MHSEPAATCRGQFFDGESAIAHEVAVRCMATVVEVTADGEVMAAWTYPDLQAPDALVKGRPVRLTHATTPYARLIVDDPGFRDQILAQAPHLSAKAHTLRTTKVVGLCMLIAFGFVAVGYLFLTFAPRTVAGMMPDSWRTNLGDQVEQLLVGKKKACTSADGIAALSVIQHRLTVGTMKSEQFTVRVYDLPIINAFALPGGKIVISRKLIEAADGAEGVAGVLAHEMGHVIERDSESQLVRGLGISLLQQVLFSGGSGVAEAIGGIAGLLTLVSYTREAERRADSHASAILEAAAVDPDGLIGFFETIKEKHGGGTKDENSGELVSLFRTHPGLSERIETLRNAPKWAARPVLSEQQWTALKSICSTGS